MVNLIERNYRKKMERTVKETLVNDYSEKLHPMSFDDETFLEDTKLRKIHSGLKHKDCFGDFWVINSALQVAYQRHGIRTTAIIVNESGLVYIGQVRKMKKDFERPELGQQLALLKAARSEPIDQFWHKPVSTLPNFQEFINVLNPTLPAYMKFPMFDKPENHSVNHLFIHDAYDFRPDGADREPTFTPTAKGTKIIFGNRANRIIEDDLEDAQAYNNGKWQKK
jgi:hypothetical protein